MSIRKEILSRAYIVFYVLVLASLIIIGQVVRIDTVDRAYWIQHTTCCGLLHSFYG